MSRAPTRVVVHCTEVAAADGIRYAMAEVPAQPVAAPPPLRFTTDHTGRTWYPLSTGQWGVPHLPGESDAQWRERVLSHAADDDGLGAEYDPEDNYGSDGSGGW